MEGKLRLRAPRDRAGDNARFHSRSGDLWIPCLPEPMWCLPFTNAPGRWSPESSTVCASDGVESRGLPGSAQSHCVTALAGLGVPALNGLGLVSQHLSVALGEVRGGQCPSQPPPFSV